MAHTHLARHVGREVERAIASLPNENRAEHARELTTQLLDHVATVVKTDAAESLRDQRIAAPARRLLALHRGAIPERPETPLGTSTLLTRNPKEPSFGHELARELATADRVDAIVAFVTLGGVRVLLDSLHGFARREGAQLRLLTTTFTQTTEISALDAIAQLPGASVKVSYDTRHQVTP